MRSSITNSESVAEEQVDQTFALSQGENHASYFFTKIGRWQYLIELFIGSLLLSLILVLAESQGWRGIEFNHYIKYVLYIDWVLLCFITFVESFQRFLRRFNLAQAFLISFVVLQMIMILTTMGLNLFNYFGQNLSLNRIDTSVLLDSVGLHLSYGVLLGAFCFRYLYVREQWVHQQHIELKARVNALQARIHPHFLFNSLNNVISLISIDPDKAEHMLLNLSRLFRASLQELKLVSLDYEIDLCQKYLEIEQIRLGERLNVEWKFDNKENFSEVQIPLLTLQPLLENSIFHGVEKILAKSTISVLVEVLQNQVNIVITNPFIIDSVSQRQSHGIAIQNIRQRLEAYYGRSVKFRTFTGNDLYTTVVQYRYK